MSNRENKLGQYSLLQDYNRTRHRSNCIHYVTLFLVDKAKKGRKRGKLVKLSTQVKQAVIGSLIRSNGYLTKGATALQKHTHLSWACEFATVTETILVWHVATTICKHEFDAAAALAKAGKRRAVLSVEDSSAVLSVQDSSAVDIASSLSQYCAYLVAFAPDLLPGHSFDSASILDKSIEEARKYKPLKGAKKMERKYEILKDISGANSNDPLVVQGAWLAKQLKEDIKDGTTHWKLLSDFWAEMILYVAPCDNTQVRAHLEALARGGEFITHLWALLTHAGVLKPGDPKRAPTVSEAV